MPAPTTELITRATRSHFRRPRTNVISVLCRGRPEGRLLLRPSTVAARQHRYPQQRATARHIQRPLVSTAERQVLTSSCNAPHGDDAEMLPVCLDHLDPSLRERVHAAVGVDHDTRGVRTRRAWW